jgi:Xaa-Pro aminopeptidase
VRTLNAGELDLAVSEKSGGEMRLYCGKLTRTWVFEVF